MVESNTFKLIVDYAGKRIQVEGTYKIDSSSIVSIKKITKIVPDNMVESVRLKQAIVEKIKELKGIK